MGLSKAPAISGVESATAKPVTPGLTDFSLAGGKGFVAFTGDPVLPGRTLSKWLSLTIYI
jgi:hypothetical protein